MSLAGTLRTEARRLEIERGAQASSRQFSIAFDGHLHNRRELIFRYGAAADIPDAQLALHAWNEDPAEFPSALTGEFALILFDSRDGSLLCARDHTGLRPFYWFDDGKDFHCSTDVDWFFTLPTFRAEPDEAYAAEWLAQEITTRTGTLYKGVRRLPAGHTMRVSSGGIGTPRRYWLPDFDRAVRGQSDEEYAAGFREVWREAVGFRMDNDTRAGVLLSGGVDSTSILGMVHALGKRAGAYSVVFSDGSEADESRYVDAADAMFGTPSRRFAPSEHDRASFERQAREWRVPPHMPNGFMTAEIMSAARADGLSIMMTGIGGDDFFGGFSRALAAADLLKRGDVFSALAGAGPLNTLRGARVVAASALRRLWPAGARGGDVIGRRVPWIGRSLTSRVGLAERLAPAAVNACTFIGAAMERRVTSGWQAFAIESEFAAAAKRGIELTHPFFDRRVVEFAARLPEEQRHRRGLRKFVLRNAMRGLIPESVRTRRTKAYFDELFPRALECVEAGSFMRNMRLSDLGWIEESRLRAGYEEMLALVARRRDAIHLSWPIWMAVSLEAWLRSL